MSDEMRFSGSIIKFRMFSHPYAEPALTQIRWWKRSLDIRKCQNLVSFVSISLVIRFYCVAVLGDALATFDQNKGKVSQR